MAAVTVTIAETIKTLITAATLSQTDYVVERSYADWDLDLAKIDSLQLPESQKLRIDIASHTTEQKVELSTRGTVQFLVPIDIAIRRGMGADKIDATTGRIDVAEVDALVLLVEEIHLLLTKLRTSDALAAVWQGAEILANPVKQHLKELSQFTGIVRLTMRADVAV